MPIAPRRRLAACCAAVAAHPRVARSPRSSPARSRCAPLPGAATMYKWVDDKGVVHYSDKMPPEAVNKGNTQLSPQGIPVKKVDPAATPEAVKAREAEQERQKEAARQQGEQARRDRALLDSYTTEADIDLARARAVKTVEDALQSAAGYRAQLQKRKVALLERKASYGGKPVPPDIDRDLAAIDAELARRRQPRDAEGEAAGGDQGALRRRQGALAAVDRWRRRRRRGLRRQRPASRRPRHRRSASAPGAPARRGSVRARTRRFPGGGCAEEVAPVAPVRSGVLLLR